MRRLTIDRAGSCLRRCEQMRWSVLASLLLVGVIACGSADAPGPGPSAPSPSVSTPSPTVTPIPEPTFSRAGCPVTDDAFCDTATQIGRALLQRDAATLLRLSRADTIECARVERQYFPGCADADVLTGHGLSSADFIVDVLPRSAYARGSTRSSPGSIPGSRTSSAAAPRP